MKTTVIEVCKAKSIITISAIVAMFFLALLSRHYRSRPSNDGDVYEDLANCADDEVCIGYVEDIGMTMPIHSRQNYVLVVDGDCSVCISHGLEYISMYLDKERSNPLIVAVRSESIELFLYYFESVIGTDHDNVNIAGSCSPEAKTGLYYINDDKIKSYEPFSR